MDFEIAQTPSVERKTRVNSLMASISPHFVLLDTNLIKRGKELESIGFDVYDALYVACAEQGEADVFLTTDDKLRRLGVRYSQQLNVRIENPLKWFQERIDESASNDIRTDSPDGN